jgi:hypothetical protein
MSMLSKQLFTFILLFASGAFAGPSGINLSGKISVQPSGTSLSSADVDFRIRVLSPNGCVLYTERFDNLDLASTNGAFNLTIGHGSATFNAWDATPATRNSKASLLKLFSNSSPAIASGLTPYGAGPCVAGAYAPTADDGRQVVIELDPTGAGTPGSFLALSPYHQIRAVPYAMLADMASDSEKLGGVDAAQYAKTTDLTAAVPANETDPTVKTFAKTNLPDCVATGKVLTANAAGVLSCVAGGAGSYTLPAATASTLGGLIVGSGLSVAVDGTVSVSNTLTTDITNLQTAVGNKVDKASMAVCATNQVLVWQSPGDNFLCSNILITASQVSDFNTAVDARITAGGTASPKLPLAGGTMTGSITVSGTGLVINLGNNNLANVSYLHLENKTADPVFSAGNNGYVWYNSTDKAIKFNDGTAIRSLAVGGAGGAPTGAAGGDLAGTYPNPTLKATGTAGTYVKVTTDAEGRVLSGSVLVAADIPGLDAAKIITGQFGDARISDVGVDKISSGASKYFTYAPNNVACANGEVLKKTANGWECGADAGSGGADASSIRGATVDGVATASIGEFMQHDGTKWTFVSMPVCAANKVLTFNASGVASCADIAGLVDANIAAGAAIARTKLAAGTADHVLINNGSGVMSSEAQLAVTRGGTGQSTYTNGQLLIGKTDGTLAKATLTAGSGVTVTNGDGTITIASTGNAAPTGAAGGDLTGTYPNPTLVATGTAGTYTKVTTDAEGRVTVGATLAATDIPALDAAKITTGQFADARLAGISVDKVTSGAAKYFTYAPNNVACSNGEVLKKTANGWECGADAGSGGADASSIRGAAVDGVATAAIGNFMQHDGTKWTFVSMPQCAANKTLTFSVIGVATCVDIAGLVDANIAAGAAIARTKLASGTADHVLINNGSGVMSSEAQLSVTRGGTGQSTYTNGQILIGKTDGTLAKSTITAGSGVTVTNGDGTITIASTGGGAPTGAAGGDLTGTYPNPTLVATGTSGTYTKVTTDAEGRVTVGAALAATDIPALDAAKITTGQFADARLAGISVDKVTSGAAKYLTYAPNNVACANGEILKKTANGWECGTDSGAGGSDAISIRSVAVDGVATAGQGNFMQHDGVKWTFVSMPVCTADKVITFSVAGIATCTSIGGLVDSQIAAGAAIARTKLANGTANHVLINNGTGVMSSEAQLAVSRGGTGQSTYTDGQILIGKTDGTLAKTTITAGSGVTVTNGDGTITIASSGGGAPTGAAGGDLAGTYPNPTLKATGTSGTYTKVTTDAEGRVTVGAALAATDIPALDAAKITTGQFADARLAGISVDKVTSGASKYFTYAPNNVACANGEVLKKTANGWECGTDTSGGAPSGAAGGDLTGTYPNPTLKATGTLGTYTKVTTDAQGRVTVGASLAATDIPALDAAKITTGQFADAMISDLGVDKISSGASKYFTYKPNNVACAAGEFLAWNNSRWECTPAPAGAADTLAGLSCASGNVPSWNGAAWVCQTTGNTNVASSIVKRSAAGAISAGIADFTGVRVFDSVSGYITLQTPATVTSYSLTLPTGTGTNGQMLTTDGSGVLSWSSPSASLPGLTSASIWVGNGSGVATAVSMSGDATIDNAGAITIGASKVNSSKIVDDSIMNADINSAAAIARSKIASGTNYALVTNNSSGVMGAGLACATVGHVPTWTAGGFTCQAPAGSLPALTSAFIWVGNGSTVATAVAPSGDVTMTNAGAFSVTKLQGSAVSATTPTAGQVLMYLSSTWTPTSPTSTGASSSLLLLDSSGVANAFGVAVKGTTSGIATILAPTSFSNYTLRLPSDDGTANQMLKTDGSGNLSWTTPGGAPSITSKTADFTVGTNEENYFYMISNAVTATLPSVGSVPAGYRLTFKRMGGSNVNVLASGAELIDGANQRSLQSTYQSMTIINTGSEWAVINGGGSGTVTGCVPGSQSYSGAGSYSLNIDATRASKCTFTVTVQGGGGGNSVANGGRGGAVQFTYTASGAGSFEVSVGGAGGGSASGVGGTGGGGAGGNGSTNKGGGGGGASAVRFTTSSPTDVLLAVAGGGGGGAGGSASNVGGNGGSTGAGSQGVTWSGTNEYGRGGSGNVGGAGGTAATNGGAGGSSGGAGTNGAGTGTAAGGSGIAAFTISGGGGGAAGGTNASGGGGAGYGGGGGGAYQSTTVMAGGGGGGGYISGGVLSFTPLTGPASGTNGSVLIEWN